VAYDHRICVASRHQQQQNDPGQFFTRRAKQNKAEQNKTKNRAKKTGRQEKRLANKAEQNRARQSSRARARTVHSKKVN
jgi:hypothetical protein